MKPQDAPGAPSFADLSFAAEEQGHAGDLAPARTSLAKFLARYGRDLVFQIDSTGVYRFVSPNHLTLLGFEAHELLCRDAREIVHPDDWPGLFNVRNLVTLRLRHRDGHFASFEGAILPGGEGVFCICQHQSQSQLLEEEFSTLMRIAREMNGESDLKGLLDTVSLLLRPFIPIDQFFITSLENEEQGMYLRLEATNSSNPKPFPTLKRKENPHHPLWAAIELGELFSRENLPLNLPYLGQLRSFINVPLWFEGRVAGVLHFDCFAPIHWREDQLRLAQFVGEQFAAKVQSVRDARERQQQETELAQSNALLRATQEAAAEGICLVNDAGELVSYNRRFARLWGFESDEENLFDISQVMHYVLGQLADPDEFLIKINELFDARDASARDETRLTDGRIFERYSAPALSDDGRSFGRVWTFCDITERKNYEAQLTHQAFHDAVTGLPNRVLFTDHLRHALTKIERTNRSVAVLFLDLDRFKVVNDSLGHEKGDQLLVQVAARLRQSLRPGDIAARFGGDEFVILLEEVDSPDDATRIADRIAANLRPPFELEMHEVAVTASIGIVITASGEEGADDLLRKADVAMYRAKNKGKAQYEIFSEQLSGEALDRLQLELDLTTAIKRQELEVWYQPIVDLPTGRVRAFEALVRWNHPQRGMVSPGQFVPVAEETGQIVAIDAFVLRVACAQAKTWSEELGEAVTMHVNLSVRGFEQPHLPEAIARILGESGLNAAQLMLEITESSVMTDAKSAIAQLGELKKLGISISIDDFGTGYSSLAYLEFFPIDLLKIDRAFVARLAEGTTLVRAIASLGHALSMEVAAEGIENENQLAQLRDLGVRWGQGFLISRPVPFVQAEKLLHMKF